jgi:hypothetical protein
MSIYQACGKANSSMSQIRVQQTLESIRAAMEEDILQTWELKILCDQVSEELGVSERRQIIDSLLSDPSIVFIPYGSDYTGETSIPLRAKILEDILPGSLVNPGDTGHFISRRFLYDA